MFGRLCARTCPYRIQSRVGSGFTRWGIVSLLMISPDYRKGYLPLRTTVDCSPVAVRCSSRLISVHVGPWRGDMHPDTPCAHATCSTAHTKPFGEFRLDVIRKYGVYRLYSNTNQRYEQTQSSATTHSFETSNIVEPTWNLCPLQLGQGSRDFNPTSVPLEHEPSRVVVAQHQLQPIKNPSETAPDTS